MPMQIKIHENFSFLLEGPDQLFDSEINRVKRFVGGFPSSVEILSCQRAPVVAVDDAVRVQNGHNFEDEVVSERPSLWCFADQIVNEALHHPTGIALPRMHPRTDENAFLGFGLGAGWVLILAGDGQVLAFIASQRPGQRPSVKVVLAVSVLFDFGQILLQVRIRIWKTVTKIAHVVIVLKFSCESERVIIPGEAIHFFFVIILKVIDILTRSMPADVLFRLTFI